MSTELDPATVVSRYRSRTSSSTTRPWPRIGSATCCPFTATCSVASSTWAVTTSGSDTAACSLRYGDGSKIELLEPLEGSTFLDSFFRRNPLGGLHHVTFKIVSMADTLTALAGLGYTVHGQSDADPNWNEVFVHPREALGTLLQMAQAGPNYGEPPESGLADVLAGRGNHGNGVPSPLSPHTTLEANR